MTRSLFSPSWYRVSGLRPRLRAHAEIHRQRFRGDIWYVLQDHQSGQYHRLSPPAHQIVCRMDGRRTVGDIWAIVGERMGEDQPTQEEVVRLMAQLHRADLLVGESAPNMDELSDRSDRQSRRGLLMRLRNPLALRFPLFDPDRWLTRTLPPIRPAFTIGGFLLWLVLVIGGGVVAAINFGGLTDNLTDRLFTNQSLFLLVCLYPLVKACHELGHAYATKNWGGEVHELGVMLLILVPVPYVDASSSSAFRSKWRRAVVGAAGILVETALAAVAVLVWVGVEPGLVRAIAFNVILIGGVSTLLFNGNPLLRLDGYYILSDLLEIPNLGSRSNQYVLYIIQRYGFGVAHAESPVTARGEAAWFLGYAVAAFVYRIVILLTIAVVVAGKLFLFGVLLAALSLVSALVIPLFKGLKFLLDSPSLDRKRGRALGVTLFAVASLAVLVLALPFPDATMAQGVVWVGDQATVRAPSDGFVTRVVTADDSWVDTGTVLVATEDSILVQGLTVLERQRDGLQRRLESVTMTDLVQANMLREQLRHIDGQLSLARQHVADLDVVAPKPGRFLIADAADLPGRFIHKGDVVGYVVADSDAIVRVVVPQNDADLVRRSAVTVSARLSEALDRVVPAAILREVPAALAELPHLSLSTTGGGTILLDPGKTDHPKPLETLFHFDLRLAEQPDAAHLGERVYVRFGHPRQVLAVQVFRAFRQLLLRQFSV